MNLHEELRAELVQSMHAKIRKPGTSGSLPPEGSCESPESDCDQPPGAPLLGDGGVARQGASKNEHRAQLDPGLDPGPLTYQLADW